MIQFAANGGDVVIDFQHGIIRHQVYGAIQRLIPRNNIFPTWLDCR